MSGVVGDPFKDTDAIKGADSDGDGGTKSYDQGTAIARPKEPCGAKAVAEAELVVPDPKAQQRLAKGKRKGRGKGRGKSKGRGKGKPLPEEEGDDAYGEDHAEDLDGEDPADGLDGWDHGDDNPGELPEPAAMPVDPEPLPAPAAVPVLQPAEVPALPAPAKVPEERKRKRDAKEKAAPAGKKSAPVEKKNANNMPISKRLGKLVTDKIEEDADVEDQAPLTELKVQDQTPLTEKYKLKIGKLPREALPKGTPRGAHSYQVKAKNKAQIEVNLSTNTFFIVKYCNALQIQKALEVVTLKEQGKEPPEENRKGNNIAWSQFTTIQLASLSVQLLECESLLLYYI